MCKNMYMYMYCVIAQVLRDFIAQNVSKNIAERVRIIYGGSVSEDNCDTLGALPDVVCECVCVYEKVRESICECECVCCIVCRCQSPAHTLHFTNRMASWWVVQL
jgi:hypothetical protein